ncbi:MAG: TMEM143 family protein [Halioglobus sp.]
MIEEDSRYIDAALTDIVGERVRELPKPQRSAIAELAAQLATYYNLQFRRQSADLKSLYRHFNPSVPGGRSAMAAADRAEMKQQFFSLIGDLLGSANYRELSIEDVQKAMDEQALFDLRVSVNLDDYDRLLVYRRGASRQTMKMKRWLGRFGEREVEFINYDRVALVFTENTPGSDIHLKLFQNVPRHDIEILLPEPRVRMRLRDKLIIGVPAVVGGGIVLLTKLGPTLLLIASLVGFWLGFQDRSVTIDQGVLLALGVGLFALGGHFWRQFGALKNRRLAFLKVLTENLYFKSLDNNSGAIQQLLDTAADEEVKEVFLVYSFLAAENQPVTAAQVDHKIEQWLQQQFACTTNFDVADAADKAVALGIAQFSGGQYTSVSFDEALARVNAGLQQLVFPQLSAQGFTPQGEGMADEMAGG